VGNICYYTASISRSLFEDFIGVCIVNYTETERNSQLRKYHLVIAPNSFGIQVSVCIIVPTLAGKYLPLDHITKRLILGRGLCNFAPFVHCFKCSLFSQRT